jgi:hypothetical protein
LPPALDSHGVTAETSPSATLERVRVSSIPENPKDQFAFFFDNPVIGGEPDGKGLIKDFYDLLGSLVGIKDASGKAGMFAAADPFASAEMAPPAGDGSGKGAGDHHGQHDDAGIELALHLLGGLGRGDLDI